MHSFFLGSPGRRIHIPEHIRVMYDKPGIAEEGPGIDDTVDDNDTEDG
jgi:hypothetical protein